MKRKIVKERQEATQFTSETGKRAVYLREHPEERPPSEDASRSEDDRSGKVSRQIAAIGGVDVCCQRQPLSPEFEYLSEGRGWDTDK